MKIDLEQALNDMARSVQDDDASARMHGRVRQMVTIVRRRRAARHTAVGMVGVGAAAALAFGGLQLADVAVDEPVPPAGPSDDVVPTSDACGLTLGEMGWVQDGPVTLELVDEAPRGRTDGGLSIETQVSETEVELELWGSTRYVAVDPSTGRVAGVPEDDDWEPDWDAVVDMVGPEEAQRFMSSTSMPLWDCADGEAAPGPENPLGPGEYDVYAMREIRTVQQVNGGREFVAVGGPWRIETGPDAEGAEDATSDQPSEGASEESFSEEETAALVTLNELVSYGNEDPTAAFPQCGTSVDVLDDGPRDLVLDLDLASTVIEEGGVFVGTVDLRMVGAGSVVGRVDTAGATLVVVRDGVVVSHQPVEAGGVINVELQEGAVQEIPLHGSRNLCGTGEGGDGPALPLPLGEYQVMALVEVTLEERGTGEGETTRLTGSFTAMSPLEDTAFR
ncbi:hypothetical protein [Actinotalea sp. C106]|uniref:hypothetical protein n=1 Tax=Actinotalea sp. C106 TaxID=2908644 RepID=UPI0020279CBA|nr:hypothetical protein [Actinotalea sp. C106]